MTRETRRIIAQFLNGLAIAVLAAGIIGPLAAGSADMSMIVAAIVCGGLLHGLAIALASKGGG